MGRITCTPLGRLAIGAVLASAALGCARPSAGADDRAGLMLVDGEPELFFRACEGEVVETLTIWSNDDGDRVVLEKDDDVVLWSIDAPQFGADGRFVDVVDLPDEWWLEDTQVEIETTDGDALVIVTGVEVLEPEQVWSSSLLMVPEEFERRASESC